MKPFLFLLVCLVALFAGCSTVDSRIREKSGYFESLDPQTQTRLKQSIIHIGDTTDMVYIALGRANRVLERASGQGRETTWIYSMYWEEYEGSHFVGYQRHAIYDQYRGAWRVYYEPVHAEFYRDRIDEYLRVIFQDGKVTAIERTGR